MNCILLSQDLLSHNWRLPSRGLLVATKRLYKSVCPSVRPSVRRSVHWSVCNAFAVPPSRSDICRVYGLVFRKKRMLRKKQGQTSIPWRKLPAQSFTKWMVTNKPAYQPTQQPQTYRLTSLPSSYRMTEQLFRLLLTKRNLWKNLLQLRSWSWCFSSESVLK